MRSDGRMSTLSSPASSRVCHKATMIEIVGIRHFFDLDVYDNRSIRSFLFDSNRDADQFLSILALLLQALRFDANVRRLIASTFGFGNFVP